MNNPKPILQLRPINHDRGPFEANLITYLQRLGYDAENKVGYLDCGPNDMPGSIRIFTAIDPEVQQIISNDMVYARKPDGGWDAYRLPATRHQEQRVVLNNPIQGVPE